MRETFPDESGARSSAGWANGAGVYISMSYINSYSFFSAECFCTAILAS